MQANTPSQIQFGPGGEQWAHLPVGAPVYASDGVPIGAVAAVGTAYLRITDSMMGDGGLHIPLQTVSLYDPQTNVVHLSIASAVVRGMTGMPPANDPLSLQAMHQETLPLPVAPPPTATHEHAIPLREQELVVNRLPNVVKEVTVRRERTTGDVVVSEAVARETAHVEIDKSPE